MFRIAFAVLLGLGLMAGCSSAPQSSPVTDNIRKSLDQAGLKDVSVTQDRTNGVVTLGGHVANDADKTHADQIAQSLAAQQVVANQIAVLPAGDDGAKKTVDADLDKAIDSNMDAALVSAGFRSGIRHSVKNGVITLTGTVNTQNERARIEALAKGIPNAQQVINEIQTRHQMATSDK